MFAITSNSMVTELPGFLKRGIVLRFYPLVEIVSFVLVVKKLQCFVQKNEKLLQHKLAKTQRVLQYY